MSSSIDYFDCPKCGGQAYREQDNKTCEITIGCKCGWSGETVEQENIPSYQKVIMGHVVQEYMLNKEGKYICIEQYFEAVHEPYRENENNEVVDIDTEKEVNQDFDMVQPVSSQDFEEWFEENKNSTLLQEKFLSCLNDNPDSEHSFKSWAKDYYKESKEQ